MVDQEQEQQQLTLDKLQEKDSFPPEFFSDSERIAFYEDVAEKYRQFSSYKSSLLTYDKIKNLQKAVIRESWLKLAQAYEDQGSRLKSIKCRNYDEAFECYEKCLEILNQNFPQGRDFWIANVLSLQAECLMQQNKYKLAQQKLENAIFMREKQLYAEFSIMNIYSYLNLSKCFQQQELLLQTDKIKEKQEMHQKVIKNIKQALFIGWKLSILMDNGNDTIELEQNLQDVNQFFLNNVCQSPQEGLQQLQDWKIEFEKQNFKDQINYQTFKGSNLLYRGDIEKGLYYLNQSEKEAIENFGIQSNEFIEKKIYNLKIIKQAGFLSCRAHNFDQGKQMFDICLENLVELKKVIENSEQSLNNQYNQICINFENSIQELLQKIKRQEEFQTEEELIRQELLAKELQKRQEEEQKKKEDDERRRLEEEERKKQEELEKMQENNQDDS